MICSLNPLPALGLHEPLDCILVLVEQTGHLLVPVCRSAARGIATAPAPSLRSRCNGLEVRTHAERHHTTVPAWRATSNRPKQQSCRVSFPSPALSACTGHWRRADPRPGRQLNVGFFKRLLSIGSAASLSRVNCTFPRHRRHRGCCGIGHKAQINSRATAA